MADVGPQWLILWFIQSYVGDFIRDYIGLDRES